MRAVIYEHACSSEDVPTLVTSKLALQYSGSEVSDTLTVMLYGFYSTQLDAMQCVAKSSQNRSVSEFEKVSIQRC